jgi:hypothetical protein
MFRLADGIQIDDRAPRDPAVAVRVDGRLEDPDRNLIGRMDAQVGVDFRVGDARMARDRLGGSRRFEVAVVDDLRELRLEPRRQPAGSPGPAARIGRKGQRQHESGERPRLHGSIVHNALTFAFLLSIVRPCCH